MHVLPQRKYNYRALKNSKWWCGLGKHATVLKYDNVQHACVSLSCRRTHCWWARTDRSTHFPNTSCPIHLLCGSSTQMEIQIFDMAFQGLFSWLYVKDISGNVYEMMHFLSLVTDKVTKYLTSAAERFFQNLDIETAGAWARYRSILDLPSLTSALHLHSGYFSAWKKKSFCLNLHFLLPLPPESPLTHTHDVDFLTNGIPVPLCGKRHGYDIGMKRAMPFTLCP